MFGLCKRSITTKLMTAINVEPMERVLIKRKLSFIMRLANNKFTKTLVNNILNFLITSPYYCIYINDIPKRNKTKNEYSLIFTDCLKRLLELSERYVGKGLSHYIPLVVRLIEEYKEGFESRYIEYATLQFLIFFLELELFKHVPHGALARNFMSYEKNV
ncbi:hypothetical protein BpHYR1_017977 [Brachionus plicatilis]|uniref:Uncharacterized protein n=1 Tax=Brachionus plicatilis TaxID=10195 RepID=A0A3M7QNF3_BRAPC|nr:hypothetical protein BpHYR1_017977 [Brachionus plicatilis]